MRRSGSDSWPEVYPVDNFQDPDVILTIGGMYMQTLLMVNTLLKASTMVALSTSMVTGQFTTESRAMQQIIGCWILMK